MSPSDKEEMRNKLVEEMKNSGIVPVVENKAAMDAVKHIEVPTETLKNILQRKVVKDITQRLVELDEIIGKKVLKHAKSSEKKCSISELKCSHDCNKLTKKCICYEGMTLVNGKQCVLKKNITDGTDVSKFPQEISLSLMLRKENKEYLSVIKNDTQSLKSDDEKNVEETLASFEKKGLPLDDLITALAHKKKLEVTKVYEADSDNGETEDQTYNEEYEVLKRAKEYQEADSLQKLSMKRKSFEKLLDAMKETDEDETTLDDNEDKNTLLVLKYIAETKVDKKVEELTQALKNNSDVSSSLELLDYLGKIKKLKKDSEEEIDLIIKLEEKVKDDKEDHPIEEVNNLDEKSETKNLEKYSKDIIAEIAEVEGQNPKEKEQKLKEIKENLERDIEEKMKEQEAAVAEKKEKLEKCKKENPAGKGNGKSPHERCGDESDTNKQVEEAMKNVYEKLKKAKTEGDLKTAAFKHAELTAVAKFVGKVDKFLESEKDTEKDKIIMSPSDKEEMRNKLVEEMKNSGIVPVVENKAAMDAVKHIEVPTETLRNILQRKVVKDITQRLVELDEIIGKKVLKHAKSSEKKCSISELKCSHDCNKLTKKCICYEGMTLVNGRQCVLKKNITDGTDVSKFPQEISLSLMLRKENKEYLSVMKENIPTNESEDEKNVEESIASLERKGLPLDDLITALVQKKKLEVTKVYEADSNDGETEDQTYNKEYEVLKRAKEYQEADSLQKLSIKRKTFENLIDTMKKTDEDADDKISENVGDILKHIADTKIDTKLIELSESLDKSIMTDSDISTSLKLLSKMGKMRDLVEDSSKEVEALFDIEKVIKVEKKNTELKEILEKDLKDLFDMENLNNEDELTNLDSCVLMEDSEKDLHRKDDDKVVCDPKKETSKDKTLKKAEEQLRNEFKNQFEKLTNGNKTDGIKSLLKSQLRLKAVSDILKRTDLILDMTKKATKPSTEVPSIPEHVEKGIVKRYILNEMKDNDEEVDSEEQEEIAKELPISMDTLSNMIRRRSVNSQEKTLAALREKMKDKIKKNAEAHKGNCKITELKCSSDCDKLRRICICNGGMILDADNRTCIPATEQEILSAKTKAPQDVLYAALLLTEESNKLTTLKQSIPKALSKIEKKAEEMLAIAAKNGANPDKVLYSLIKQKLKEAAEYFIDEEEGKPDETGSGMSPEHDGENEIVDDEVVKNGEEFYNAISLKKLIKNTKDLNELVEVVSESLEDEKDDKLAAKVLAHIARSKVENEAEKLRYEMKKKPNETKVTDLTMLTQIASMNHFTAQVKQVMKEKMNPSEEDIEIFADNLLKKKKREDKIMQELEEQNPVIEDETPSDKDKTDKLDEIERENNDEELSEIERKMDEIAQKNKEKKMKLAACVKSPEDRDCVDIDLARPEEDFEIDDIMTEVFKNMKEKMKEEEGAEKSENLIDQISKLLAVKDEVETLEEIINDQAQQKDDMEQPTKEEVEKIKMSLKKIAKSIADSLPEQPVQADEKIEDIVEGLENLPTSTLENIVKRHLSGNIQNQLKKLKKTLQDKFINNAKGKEQRCEYNADGKMKCACLEGYGQMEKNHMESCHLLKEIPSEITDSLRELPFAMSILTYSKLKKKSDDMKKIVPEDISEDEYEVERNMLMNAVSNEEAAKVLQFALSERLKKTADVLEAELEPQTEDNVGVEQSADEFLQILSLLNRIDEDSSIEKMVEVIQKEPDAKASLEQVITLKKIKISKAIENLNELDEIEGSGDSKPKGLHHVLSVLKLTKRVKDLKEETEILEETSPDTDTPISDDNEVEKSTDLPDDNEDKDEKSSSNEETKDECNHKASNDSCEGLSGMQLTMMRDWIKSYKVWIKIYNEKYYEAQHYSCECDSTSAHKYDEFDWVFKQRKSNKRALKPGEKTNECVGTKEQKQRLMKWMAEYEKWRNNAMETWNVRKPQEEPKKDKDENCSHWKKYADSLKETKKYSSKDKTNEGEKKCSANVSPELKMMKVVVKETMKRYIQYLDDNDDEAICQ
ncbi:uncharacterized protein LOC120335987 isoform X3 [Styela clava]